MLRDRIFFVIDVNCSSKFDAIVILLDTTHTAEKTIFLKGLSQIFAIGFSVSNTERYSCVGQVGIIEIGLSLVECGMHENVQINIF